MGFLFQLVEFKENTKNKVHDTIFFVYYIFFH